MAQTLNTFFFCSVHCKHSKLKNKTIQILFRFCRFSSSKIFEAIGLNSCEKTGFKICHQSKVCLRYNLLYVRLTFIASHGQRRTQCYCASYFALTQFNDFLFIRSKWDRLCTSEESWASIHCLCDNVAYWHTKMFLVWYFRGNLPNDRSSLKLIFLLQHMIETYRPNWICLAKPAGPKL